MKKDKDMNVSVFVSVQTTKSTSNSRVCVCGGDKLTCVVPPPALLTTTTTAPLLELKSELEVEREWKGGNVAANRRGGGGTLQIGN